MFLYLPDMYKLFHCLPELYFCFKIRFCIHRFRPCSGKQEIFIVCIENSKFPFSIVTLFYFRGLMRASGRLGRYSGCTGKVRTLSIMIRRKFFIINIFIDISNLVKITASLAVIKFYCAAFVVY